MKSYILFAVIFFLSFSARAQQLTRKIIHAGEDISDYFTYRFPSFEEATVLFKKNDLQTYKMNFNMLLCSIQFIDPQGDTLEISKPEEIDSIHWNSSTFFYRNDYFEILAVSDSGKLVVSRHASLEPVMIGAMGVASRVGSIQGVDKYNQRYLMQENLRLNQDIYVYQKTDYFLITNTGEFIKANKGNFLKMFADDKKERGSFY